jgi:hypothetical protein
MTGSALGETPSRLTLERRFTRSDLQKGVAEKQADSLRLRIVVGAGGSLVPAFRKRAEIVLADVDRQPPNSASRPFPQWAERARLTMPWGGGGRD